MVARGQEGIELLSRRRQVPLASMPSRLERVGCVAGVGEISLAAMPLGFERLRLVARLGQLLAHASVISSHGVGTVARGGDQLEQLNDQLAGAVESLASYGRPRAGKPSSRLE